MNTLLEFLDHTPYYNSLATTPPQRWEEEMSKYEHLLEPVSCRWLIDLEGTQCMETFTDTRQLTEHVKTEHILSEEAARRSEGGTSNGGILCGWGGCGQVILGGESAYAAHVSFHPYHCFLKLLGAELQVRTSFSR